MEAAAPAGDAEHDGEERTADEAGDRERGEWRIAKPIYKQGDWNKVEIIAHGTRMELKLNGVTTVVVKDQQSSTGVIALQLHRGPGMRVEFRKIEVQPQ